MNERVSPAPVNPPGEILTEKELVIRLLAQTDAEAIFAILQNDPSIQADYINWVVGSESIDDVRQKIKSFQAAGERRYAIEKNGAVVGYIGIQQQESQKNEYDIGYFCAPLERGRGVVSDALKAIINEVRRGNPNAIITLYIRDDNQSSQAVAQKFDFVRTEETIDNEVLHCVERRWELRTGAE